MSSSLSNFPQGGSSRPFWRSPSGRIAIWLGFLALAALLIWFKSNSSKTVDNNSNSSERAGGGGFARPELLPREESEENALAFGGSLAKVQDFVDLQQNEDFWAVLRDVKNADAAAYSTPYAVEYSQLLKNPRHYRLLAKPVRVLGTLVHWWAYPAPENSTGTKDLFRILLHDGEKGYMLDTWERPPFESSDFKRELVEAVGIFYQIYRYEGQDTLDDLFRSLYSSLRKGQLSLALTQLQGILDQDPNPLIVATWTKRFEPTLWESFRAEGPDYAGALRRFDSIAAQGLTAPTEGVELKQYVKIDAPFLIAKSVRRYNDGSASSALDQFMNSSLGTVALLGIMALMVGGFFLFFLRMQRAQEEKHKKNREEFWRDVRRNIKGVTPPGDRLGGGG